MFQPPGHSTEGVQNQQPLLQEIEIALICGGRLLVITPLYSIRTQSPREKQQACWVCTRTVCRVRQSQTRS